MKLTTSLYVLCSMAPRRHVQRRRTPLHPLSYELLKAGVLDAEGSRDAIIGLPRASDARIRAIAQAKGEMDPLGT